MSPRELEAVAVAADALDGAGDPAALVVALVAEMARRGRLPENEVAVALARLIEAHPEGAGMVRVEDLGRVDDLMLCGITSGRSFFGWVLEVDADENAWRAVDNNTPGMPATYHTTREAAEAALIAAQPEPRAIVRRSA